MTLDEKRKQIGKWLHEGDGGQLWDLMCALRGPDSPSERANMGAVESRVAYAGRRKRKYQTVEVIREKAFFGVVGGAARHHDGDVVILPPTAEWDHFDHHVQRAASILGLKVEIEGRDTKKRVEVGGFVSPTAPVTINPPNSTDDDEDEDEVEEFDDDDDL